MRLYKLLTILLLGLMLSSLKAWSAEPQYTREQVDSIVAVEVERQLKDQQIELQIERVSNEKYAHSLDEQNNRLVEHERVMTGLYGFFALVVAAFGFAVPYMQNKRYEKRLNAIAKKNGKELARRTKKLDGKIKTHDTAINKLVQEAAESNRAAAKSRAEAEQSAKQAKASEYFSQALVEKDLDKQIYLYTKAIDLKSDYAEAYFNRGWAYDNNGDHDQALEDLKKAIKLTPVDADAYNNRGNAYDDKGECDKADFNEVIEQDPDLAKAYNNQGNANDDKEEYDKAIVDNTKTIDLKSDYVKAYNNRGVAYFHKREYDKVIADYTKVITLKPDDTDTYNNRGEARYKMGDYKGAIEDCSRAIELDPDGSRSESYYHRGLSYKALGGEENLKLALADAQKGLEVARRLGGKSLVKEEKFVELIKELEGENKG